LRAGASSVRANPLLVRSEAVNGTVNRLPGMPSRFGEFMPWSMGYLRVGHVKRKTVSPESRHGRRHRRRSAEEGSNPRCPSPRQPGGEASGKRERITRWSFDELPCWRVRGGNRALRGARRLPSRARSSRGGGNAEGKCAPRRCRRRSCGR
jgi:hypothetical protein